MVMKILLHYYKYLLAMNFLVTNYTHCVTNATIIITISTAKTPAIEQFRISLILLLYGQNKILAFTFDSKLSGSLTVC